MSINNDARRESWRRYQRKKRGLPDDQPVKKYFRCGEPCMYCELPVAREDKHPRIGSHLHCAPVHGLRDGDPCDICGLPVSLADRSPRRKTHLACQVAANKERQKQALKAWRGKNPERYKAQEQARPTASPKPKPQPAVKPKPIQIDQPNPLPTAEQLAKAATNRIMLPPLNRMADGLSECPLRSAYVDRVRWRA